MLAINYASLFTQKSVIVNKYSQDGIFSFISLNAINIVHIFYATHIFC